MQTNTQVQYVRLKWYDLATNEDQERIAPLPVTLGCTSENTIVLNSQLVSRQHAVLTLGPGGIILQDRESSQGTFVGQQRVTQVVLDDGNSFQVGPFHFIMTVVPPSPPQGTATVQTSTPAPPVEELPCGAIFRHSIVPMDEVRRCPGSVLETTYLAIGGGIGSFAWADHLRIWGVPPEQIVVLGPEPKPTARYQRLTRNAQIPVHERIRSNSESCPDNIWGWPSYGLREIWLSLRQRQLRHAVRIAVQIFGEPVLTDTYTPRAGDVFNAMDREARRVDWGQMWRYGWALALRKTDDGRYVVAYSGINEQGEQEQRFVVARYVHLAMGYPVIRLLADLQEYRGRTQAQRKDVVILHVFRSPVPMGHRDGHARRPVKNHVELQPFNWPKACWSGPLRIRLEQANDQQRDQMLNDWGGTTTADRKYWQRIAREGLKEGWYQIYFGQAKHIDRSQPILS